MLSAMTVCSLYRVCCALLVALLFAVVVRAAPQDESGPASAATYRVSLLPGSGELVVGKLRYREDPQRAYTPQLFYVQLLANNVQTVTAVPFNKGAGESRYLLGFSVHNAAATAAALQPVAGRTRSHALAVWVFDENGNRKRVLNDTQGAPFTQRATAHRLLASEPFTLRPAQTVYLVLEYQTRGSSYLPLFMGKADDIGQWLQRERQATLGFYALCAAIIVLFAATGLRYRARDAAGFAVLFVLGLLLTASVEGAAFEYLWPRQADWNGRATAVLLFALGAVGLLLAGATVNKTYSNIALRRVLPPAALALAVLAVLAVWRDSQMLLPWGVAASGIMLLTVLYAVASRLSATPPCVRLFYALAVLAVAALFAGGFHGGSGLPPGMINLYGVRMLYAACLLVLAVSLLCHYRAEHRRSPRT